MFRKIYEILVSFLGESKQKEYSSDTFQYAFNCPCCTEYNNGIPDGKYNLEVNFSKQLYHCWKCGETDGTKGTIYSLIRKYGNKSLIKSYKDEIERIRKSSLYEFPEYSGLTCVIDPIIRLYLPKTYEKIDLEQCPKKVSDFCKKRNIDQKTIDKFNIGFTKYNNEDYYWKNRIIIPSYNSYGELNYFVGRDFSNKSKAKYKNCDADKKSIVFQENKIDPDSDIILVEGVLDALRFPNTISMLGKSLTKDSELYNFLYNNANAKIIICLDDDTFIDETKKIYELLNFGKLYGKIYYIDLKETPYKDFSEAYEQDGKTGIINTIKTIKQFSDLDLIYNKDINYGKKNYRMR